MGSEAATSHDPFCGRAEGLRLLQEEKINRPVVWYYTPMALPVARHLPSCAIVYDCMDELSAFQGAPPELDGRPDPADQASIPHPRIGFFGVIDERVDLPLVAGLADARPDWHIVLVGPIVKCPGIGPLPA